MAGEQHSAVSGESLPMASRLEVTPEMPAGTKTWTLSGATSNERDVTRAEKIRLVATQRDWAAKNAVCAALIAIRKAMSGGH